MNSTKFGLPENIEAILCYLFGFISGIIFFVVERDNQFIKFHALQSIMFCAVITILNVLISTIFFFPIFSPQ